ncbi:hypothetical protein WJX72_001147 [[Myrmecia] bisecta]|uniref:P-type ATPase A domain-containing protein n=1 Tax=[Myrmecia] bisecta TaxID=41462 RepID=A0AAW1PGL1_9CHLO
MDPAVRYSIEDPRTLVQTSGLSFFAGATAKVQQQAHKLTVPRKADGRTLDVESFQGYRLAVWKLPLAVLVLIGTAGTILFFRGRARLSVLLYLTPCRLAGAGYVLVTLTNGRQTLTRTKTFKIDTPINFACSTVRASGMGPVEHQHVSLLNAFYNRFIYNQALDTYVPIPSVPNELTPQLVEVANWLAGRTEAATVTKQPTEDLVTTFRRAKWDRAGRCRVYGRNLRRVLLPGVVEQMFLQMFSPYCIYLYAALTFQVYFFAYYWWAVVIGSITVGMVCGNVLQVYRNNNGLTKLVHYVVDVEMLENGRTRTIKSTELVPGDIVIVKPGRMPCDMVLLWGRAIMDENMLTGEVVPIRKTPFLAQHAGLAYRPDVHSACTLQGGTEVLQAWTPGQKEAVLAMVCRTRFATAEGQLLAAVATPVANSDPQYVKDILSFITAATILGFITLIPVLAKADTDGLGPKDIAILIGNMITIATPPAIPTCLAVATAFSIFRLWRRSIIVSNAERIRLAGHISMVCFDKTGTITEAGMHFKGVLPVVEGHIMSLQVQQFEWSQPMRVLLATCHGLISLDGRLMGEDLDKQPFVSMGASFVGADLVSLPSAQQGLMRTSFEAAGVSREDAAEYEDDQWLSLLRQFEFSSNRQRNVVVVKALDSDDYVVNAKGSPEAILKLVDPQSVPSNFETVLDDYASLGFRMVAIATGRLPRHVTPEEVASQTQEEIEAAANLRLLGLCVIVNKLHPESKGTLKRLHNRAQMRTVMVTGDHVITAISVAKMCGMMYERRPVCVIDAVPKGRMDESLHIIFTAVHTQPKHSVALPRQQALQTIAAGQSQCAITGPGFVEMLRRNDREVIDVVLQNITVAARMLPHHKQDLVALLGLGVDAGRYGHEHIKTAHVGVSLSATDACVAAPFTARNRNVASMAAMLAEGRCSLVITYYMFQYMIIYSIDELILTNIASLYGLSPANSQYLLMDVLFVLVLTILIALTGPETSLTREKPPGRLMSLANVLPCIVQMAVATVAQLGSLKLIQLQPWYVKTDVLANPDLAGGCQTVEVMVVFLVSLGHLIFPVFILSRHTRPHTRALRTNKPLALWLVACSMFICYMIFETRPNKLTEYYCQVDTLPMKFRGQLFAYIIACFIVAVAADSLLRRMMKRFGLNGPPHVRDEQPGCVGFLAQPGTAIGYGPR